MNKMDLLLMCFAYVLQTSESHLKFSTTELHLSDCNELHALFWCRAQTSQIQTVHKKNSNTQDPARLSICDLSVRNHANHNFAPPSVFLPSPHLVHCLYVASQTRHVLLTGGGAPQEHGEVVTPTGHPFR
jgi:hypothetical protein